MEGRHTPPSRPPNPALPYREDCWSEGETSVLIDAWGDRYVELNRGNLRQKQWQEVADAVNSRPCDARRPPRTDVQCKNRIDTLKKKYKLERSKIVEGASPISQWVFYDRLDDLVGNSVPLKRPPHLPPLPALPAPPRSSSPPMALPLPSHRKGFPLPTASVARPVPPLAEDDSYYRRKYSPPDEDDSDTDSSLPPPPSSIYARPRAMPPAMMKERARKRVKREVKEDGEVEDGIQELSRAILRLGEIYEKVELEKHKQMMELEKQRIEFAKSVEMQRMQMFVDSQVELKKMERGKGGNRSANGEDRSSTVIPFLLQPVLL